MDDDKGKGVGHRKRFLIDLSQITQLVAYANGEGRTPLLQTSSALHGAAAILSDYRVHLG